MNFDTLVMQLLTSGRQVNPHGYSVDNAIADATKVKLAYDSMLAARNAQRTVGRGNGQALSGSVDIRGRGMSGELSGGVVGLGGDRLESTRR